MTKGKGEARKSKEALKPVDDRQVGKRKAASKPEKRIVQKSKKAKKDPNKPKRPPSAFFVFLEEFRKTFKAENPNVKAVSAVGKAGGEKWKSLTKAKAPYEAKAAKRKVEYEKLMNAYNKKQASSANDGDDESDKSNSEVNDEEDDSSREDGHKDDEDDEDEDDE
ncbi:putative chromatin remodeling & transcriptional activation HMG family [Lupinus albus]|uniref:Putative chromatin remodeling & transcriptional activation HMG family n=1 Tax=Lupinus albus TaxID=3870 RepID=A0A6A4NE98_LUPAL|nr:putative chromatin remodeling & transcriptional activation HMG family [Lupinus albus]